MNTRKIEMKQNRLNRIQAQVEAHRKVLATRGLDEKRIENNPVMRHLLAEARQMKRIIETLNWEPPKVASAQKKTEKPGKEAAPPKAPKPPKEKKPAKNAQAPLA